MLNKKQDKFKKEIDLSIDEVVVTLHQKVYT